MATLAEIEAFDVAGPAFGRIACLAVTSTSAAPNLASDTYVGADVSAGRLMKLQADGADVYYAWSNAADTIVDTATGATAGKCGLIPDGTFVCERPPRINGVPYTYLAVKTATGFTATLRISATSQSQTPL